MLGVIYAMFFKKYIINNKQVQYNFQSWRNWGLHPSICQVFGQSRRSRCALWLHTLYCSGGLRAGVSHGFLFGILFWLLCVSASLFFCFYHFSPSLPSFLLSLLFALFAFSPFLMLFHRFAAFFLPRFPAAWPLCFHLLLLSFLTFMLSCFPAFVP